MLLNKSVFYSYIDCSWSDIAFSLVSKDVSHAGKWTALNTGLWTHSVQGRTRVSCYGGKSVCIRKRLSFRRCLHSSQVQSNPRRSWGKVSGAWVTPVCGERAQSPVGHHWWLWTVSQMTNVTDLKVIEFLAPRLPEGPSFDTIGLHRKAKFVWILCPLGLLF